MFQFSKHFAVDACHSQVQNFTLRESKQKVISNKMKYSTSWSAGTLLLQHVVSPWLQEYPVYVSLSLLGTGGKDYMELTCWSAIPGQKTSSCSMTLIFICAFPAQSKTRLRQRSSKPTSLWREIISVDLSLVILLQDIFDACKVNFTC